MKLRVAVPDDLEELVGLWVEFMDYHSALDSHFVRAPGATDRWAAYITGKLSDPDFRVLVADTGESLAGYVVARVMEYPPIITTRSFGFVQDMAVSAEHRRSGVGRELFEAVESWLLSRGVPQIEVKVDVLNPAARGFWDAAGFSPHTETLIKKYPRPG